MACFSHTSHIYYHPQYNGRSNAFFERKEVVILWKTRWNCSFGYEKRRVVVCFKKTEKKNTEEKEKKRLFQSTNKWKKQSNRVKSLMEFMKSVIKDVGSLSCWL